MLFTLVDLILIVAVLFFVIIGFLMGFISAIGALVGVVAGAWLAGMYFIPFAIWLNPYLLGNEGAAKIIAFVIIFGLVNRIVSLLFWLINKMFNLISIIPFLKSINRIGGATLGLIEGALITGLVVFVAIKFGEDIAWLYDNLNSSQVAHWLVWLTQALSNFIPSI